MSHYFQRHSYWLKVNQTGLRASKGYRAVWLLIATAIRLAQALGLDRKNGNHSPFETEMRRRIWFAIGILDLQAAFDGGSYSLLTDGALFNYPPLHINDIDISINSLDPPPIRSAYSDMTFCSTTHEMLQRMREMLHAPVDAEGHPLVKQNWTQRLAIVNSTTRNLEQKYLIHCDNAETFQRFTKVVAEAMLVLLRLLVRRPMYRISSVGPPPDDGFSVLDTATEVLESTARKSDHNEFGAWQWFGWNKWYALAVLLAELCEFTEGPRIDRAWVIAEDSFEKYKDMIYDTALSNSMQRLLRRARKARAKSLGLLAVPVDQSSLSLEHPAETSCMSGQGISFTYRDSHDQSTSSEEFEMLSWINWDAFVQDVGDSSHLNMVDPFQ